VATFSAQVVDLVGTFSDETALDSFITEGANEVINAMPRSMLDRIAEETTVTSGTTTSEGHKVISMTRNDGTIDQPCRYIPSRKRGRAADSSDMEYATATDPVYYIQDGKFSILPSGGSGNKLASVPTYSQASALDASSLSAITNFPNEAEYLVTLYAAIKALQQNMSGKLGNSDITTALTAINTELDETQAICDLINTQVDSAVSELAEAAALVDSGVDTATAAITTALGRVNTAVALANAEFDLVNPEVDLANTEVDSEDLEKAQGYMSTAQGYASAGSQYISEAQASLGEAQGYAGEVAARTGQVSSQVGVAQGYISAAQGYANEIQAKIGIAQGYTSEVQTRLAVDTAEYSWYEKQQAKLQADYDKGIQIMRGG